MRAIDPEQDLISDPPKEPIVLAKPHAVGDKVTYTMPWMNARSVLVTSEIVEIEGDNALLKATGFFGGSDERSIEPLANLSPWTDEDEEYLKSFDNPEVDEKNKKVIDDMIDKDDTPGKGYVDQD